MNIPQRVAIGASAAVLAGGTALGAAAVTHAPAATHLTHAHNAMSFNGHTGGATQNVLAMSFNGKKIVLAMSFNPKPDMSFNSCINMSFNGCT